MTEARENGRLIEGNSPIFFYIKKGNLPAIQPGLDPHHIFRTDLFFEPIQR